MIIIVVVVVVVVVVPCQRNVWHFNCSGFDWSQEAVSHPLYRSLPVIRLCNECPLWDYFEPYPKTTVFSTVFRVTPVFQSYLLRFGVWLVCFFAGPKSLGWCVFTMFLFRAPSVILVRASPRPFQVLMTMIIVCIRHIRPAHNAWICALTFRKASQDKHKVVVVSKILYFHPYLGKIPILTSIFFNWVGSTTN